MEPKSAVERYVAGALLGRSHGECGAQEKEGVELAHL